MHINNCFFLDVCYDESEHTQGAIIIRISTMAKRKSTKGQTTIYKTYI
jgi:hypothetical protein